MSKERSLFVNILYSRRLPYLVVSFVLCLMIVPPFLHHSYSTDGGYTHWSHWTACSVTCGTGIQGKKYHFVSLMLSSICVNFRLLLINITSCVRCNLKNMVLLDKECLCFFQVQMNFCKQIYV